MFIEIPPDVLRSVATDSVRMPRLYYHPNVLARKFFWWRLRVLHGYFAEFPVKRGSCLDFGCGSGVFLPSLATVFSKVTAIDIETSEATDILRHYPAPNVELVQADLYRHFLPSGSFDAITAPDVLEHFSDLEPPVERIREWLKPDGYLLTSLPTESLATRGTRWISNEKKPWDHYHTGYAVEEFLLAHGFRRLKRRVVTPLFPLYLVSIWQKS